MRNNKQLYLALIVSTLAFACGVLIDQVLFRFSSPSGTGAATLPGPVPVLIDDPNDIIYWPSIDELQWFAQTKRDGFFREISQADYEARRWDWYCNMAAKDTWPREVE